MNEDTWKEFGLYLRNKRREQGLSRSELAMRTQTVSKEEIREIEAGRLMPGNADARALIDALQEDAVDEEKNNRRSLDSEKYHSEDSAKSAASHEKLPVCEEQKESPNNAEKGRRIDLRIPDPNRQAQSRRTRQLIYQLNQTDPTEKKYRKLLEQLFSLPESSNIEPPVYVNLAPNIHIGERVYINAYFKAMSAGSVWIEDDAKIAFNVSVATNNHDPYQREILTVQDVRICKGAWIGAGSIILPGVRVGKYAIVGAGSVVTRDVPDYAVAAGNPARILKMLDPARFSEQED